MEAQCASSQQDVERLSRSLEAGQAGLVVRMDAFRGRLLAPRRMAAVFAIWHARALLRRMVQTMRARILARRDKRVVTTCFDAWNVVVDDSCDAADLALHEVTQTLLDDAQVRGLFTHIPRVG